MSHPIPSSLDDILVELIRVQRVDGATVVTASPDANVERNRQLLLDRSVVGLKKYGVTTERTDLNLPQWLQHILEELLDAANYVQAAKMQMKVFEAIRSFGEAGCISDDLLDFFGFEDQRDKAIKLIRSRRTPDTVMEAELQLDSIRAAGERARTVIAAVQEPAMANGLSKSETSASASVAGLVQKPEGGGRG